MEKALFTKEWLKTRIVFWICLIAGIALFIYYYLTLKRIEVGKGIDHITLIMLLKDQIFAPKYLPYFPIITGLAVGAAQMLPEMLQKRLKLTLHLPVSMYKSIGWMLGVGYAELLLIFVIQAIGICWVMSCFVVPELVSRVMLTILPWYVAGFVAYSFTAAICLEGTIFRRVVIALAGLVVIWLLYESPALEAYNSALWLLLILFIILPFMSFSSVFRFKEGRMS